MDLNQVVAVWDKYKQDIKQSNVAIHEHNTKLIKKFEKEARAQIDKVNREAKLRGTQAPDNIEMTPPDIKQQQVPSFEGFLNWCLENKKELDSIA